MNKKRLVAAFFSVALVFGMFALGRPGRKLQAPQEQPPAIPDHVVYKFLFHHIAALRKKADELELDGKDGRQLRTHYQRKAGLSAEQASVLDQIAGELNEQLQVQGLRARILIDAYRAQYPGGKVPHGEKPQPPPAELTQMVQERDAIVLRGRDRLRAALGDEEFNRFNDFVRIRVAPQVQQISPQQMPPSSAGDQQ